MKRILAVLAIATAVCGLEYDGFRVKFGQSSDRADQDHFFNVPRTVKDAEAGGWKLIERPPGPMPELKMYCTKERAVCPLFDKSGFVAGLQIGFPADKFQSLAVKTEKLFVKWRAPAFEKEPSKDFWTATQFFVSEESLKAGSGPRVEKGTTLQYDGVWVTGPDGKILKIASTEAELDKSAYKKQGCIPNMGYHYYYNMTPKMKCEEYFPWFVLTSNSKMIGTGFQLFGNLDQGKSGAKQWFELFPKNKQRTHPAIPTGPQCLYDWVGKYDIVSLHIYYIDKPWTIRC